MQPLLNMHFQIMSQGNSLATHKIKISVKLLKLKGKFRIWPGYGSGCWDFSGMAVKLLVLPGSQQAAVH